jgi:hypothetical protein
MHGVPLAVQHHDLHVVERVGDHAHRAVGREIAAAVRVRVVHDPARLHRHRPVRGDARREDARVGQVPLRRAPHHQIRVAVPHHLRLVRAAHARGDENAERIEDAAFARDARADHRAHARAVVRPDHEVVLAIARRGGRVAFVRGRRRRRAAHQILRRRRECGTREKQSND